MTKTMKLGDKLAADLRDVIRSLSALADSIEGATPAQNADAPAASEAQANVQTVSAQSQTYAEPLTLEAVRAVLGEKSRAGFTAQVRELLLAHGADRLSAIDPAEYAALMEEAEGLANG
jgi:hypothetical protein